MFSKEKEKRLIEKIRHGDTVAFKEFISLHKKTISNVVIGMLGNNPSAEDVAQDVFIKFYYNINKFREESSAKTYLTRIAINLSLNEIKKKNLQKQRFETSDDLRNYENINILNPDNFELKEILQRELQKLEERQRAVFILRIIEGYSTRETSEILKIPEGTVLSRLYRSTEALRERLKEFKP